MFRSKHTQSMTEPIRAEISKSNQCDAEGHTVKVSAPVLAMCRKLVEAGYILLRRFTLTEAIPFASRSARSAKGRSGQRKHCRCWPRKFGRYFYLLADRRRRQRSTSFPRRAKRPCNGHLGALIEATSPDRTIAEARTR